MYQQLITPVPFTSPDPAITSYPLPVLGALNCLDTPQAPTGFHSIDYKRLSVNPISEKWVISSDSHDHSEPTEPTDKDTVCSTSGCGSMWNIEYNSTNWNDSGLIVSTGYRTWKGPLVGKQSDQKPRWSKNISRLFFLVVADDISIVLKIGLYSTDQQSRQTETCDYTQQMVAGRNQTWGAIMFYFCIIMYQWLPTQSE